jgi:hypothetical protein
MHGTFLFGKLLNIGELGGTLSDGGTRLNHVQVSISGTLVGTLTVGDSQGTALSLNAGSSGIRDIRDMFSPAFYQLSDVADQGKVRVSWTV